MERTARDAIGSQVSIENISKAYGTVLAVDNVSFVVGKGEFVSLLGPSGSGKSTLLMMIAGFEMPGSGSIRVGERDITNVAPNKRGIGMVFQRYALFPHMTVAQNIAFPLKMRGATRAEIDRRVEAALALVRLEAYGHRMPSQLSGGQQQRIAVARALVFEPPVLLMDEPLGALDKKLREEMQIEIKSLQQRLGVTVIYVTHDQEEALTMSDRVAVMSNGRLVQIGSPLDLYEQPETPFVADFIGKMNFLRGEFIGGDEQCAVIGLPGDVKIEAQGLHGTAAQFATGKPVDIAMRPERLTLHRRGLGGDSAIPGTVETAIFAGSFHTVFVRVEGAADPVHVQLPASGLGVGYGAGDSVDVVVDRGAVKVFAAEV
ncbi:ABC transporter ATP-binding protein [Aureimonas fodinaquatilis]|uniref:Spermidine/putrescine import ATP-binding protein PotA n=1 Tax=Aureimonas fodinaquatilis TaxID=2565783 RepID=A0A5B0DSV1_9HYPH|nr:ABC transporter ATP-binding protein [Aureimonas fodinaquatilis]KAA0969473.1 ABC transporter ATP-binding protein [Aureimonas fodinaquatilis]